MYICTPRYIYIYIYIYIYTHTHTHTHSHIYIPTSIIPVKNANNYILIHTPASDQSFRS